jgi:hypothetical protein
MTQGKIRTSLIFVVLLASINAIASRQLVLKTVGAVEDKVITNRDVEASFLVDRALYNDGPLTPITYGTEEFTSALNRLLIEWMVRDEASAFGVAKVSDSEIDDAYRAVKQKIDSHSIAKSKWANLEIRDQQLKELIGRKLRANRFIKYKSNSSYVQVSDDEARDYFNKNRLKFGTMDFESFKVSIKKYLEKKNAEDRLRDWLDILRKKHKVKNLVTKDTVHDSHSAGH